jgi:hypothetical protein
MEDAQLPGGDGAASMERLVGRIEGWFGGLSAKLDELKADMEQLRDRAAGWESVRQATDALERARLDHEGRIRDLEAKSQHIVPRAEHEVRAAELNAKLGEMVTAQQSLVAQQQGARTWLRDAGAVGGLLALVASAGWWLFQHLPAAPH